MKVLILHDYISNNPKPDELDNFNEAKSVEAALKNYGFETILFACTNFLEKDILNIKNFNADFVFNLVETYEGLGKNSFIIPNILESMNINYTGSSAKNIWTTTNKILTKEILLKNNIKTPFWSLIDETANEFKKLENKNLVICKSINEDASIGIDKNSVFNLKKVNINTFDRKSYFLEEYIEGREFNVAIYEDENQKPNLLPVSEIVFKNRDKNSINILDYDSKWAIDSVEYENSVRSFEFAKQESALLNDLKDISIKIWKVFKLSGYIRVDFRVDINMIPFVLEINANPCIAEDSGFAAAFKEAGYSYEQMIELLIKPRL